MKKTVSVIAFILALLLMLPTFPVFAEGETTTPKKPKIVSANLEFTGSVNMYFKLYLGKDVDVNNTECGMIFWTAQQDEYTYEKAVELGVKIVDGKEATPTTYLFNGTTYNVKGFSYPVEVTKMADSFYMQGYVSNGDGTYTVGNVIEYSPKIYAQRMLSGEKGSAPKFVNLVMSMLDFGANAQIYFDYNTDNLANDLSEEKITQVSTAAQLQSAVTAGSTVYLKNDITLTGAVTLGDNVTVYGNGYTISGYGVWAGENNTIKDVVFEAPVSSKNDASNLYCGGSITIENCTFKGTQWDAIQLTPGDGDTIVINNCKFEAPSSAEGVTPQRFIHIEVKNGSACTAKVSVTMTNNKFGTAAKLTNDMIGIYGVDETCINYGGNNTFADYSGTIWIGWAANTYANNQSEVYGKMGGIGVYTAEELKAALAAGGNYMLMNDIDMTGITWDPEVNGGMTPYSIVLNGNDHTIAGLTNALINCEPNANVTIRDLTVDEAEIGDTYAGGMGIAAFIGYMDAYCTATLENCHLTNSTIIGSNDFPGVAGLVGYKSGNGALTMKGCSVKNCTITGKSNGAGLVGYIACSATIENCTVSRCTINGENANKTGDIVGTVNGSDVVVTVNNCICGEKVFGRILSGAKLIVNEAQYIADGVTLNSEGVYEISNANGLFWFAGLTADEQSKKDIKLTADIDLGNKAWTPICNSQTQYSGTFDGNGKTIYNLSITAPANAGKNEAIGLFAWSNGTIKNLTIDGATVTGNHYAGTLIGYMQVGTVENCHVKNAKVTSTHMDDDKCGDKVGALIGFTNVNNIVNNIVVNNCSATDCTVTAARDAAQLIGYGYTGNTFTNLSATNVTVVADATGCTHERAGVVSKYALVGNGTSAGLITVSATKGEDGYYHITSAAEFVDFINNYVTYAVADERKYVLDCDIDLGGYTITTTAAQGNRLLDGTGFDGQNHTVSNFTIDSTVNGYYGGLFGYMAGSNTSYIKNLTVENAIVIGGKQTGVIVGGINGDNSTVENCKVYNSIVVGIEKVGAVVGYTANGIVKDCYAENCTVYCEDSEMDQAGEVVGFINTQDAGCTDHTENNSFDKVTVERGIEVTVVSSADTLKSALEAGENVVLAADITVSNWTPVQASAVTTYNPQYNGTVVINGNGHSISGLTTSLLADNYCTDLTVKNLTIKDSAISYTTGTGSGVGALVGYMNTYDVTLEKCRLDNVKIVAAGNNLQEGGFIGSFQGGNLSVDGCTAKNCEINADSSAGAIVGLCLTASGKTQEIKNCVVESCTISSNDDGGWRIGAIVGTANGDSTLTISGCTESGNTYTMSNSSATNPGHNLYGRTVGATVTVK